MPEHDHGATLPCCPRPGCVGTLRAATTIPGLRDADIATCSDCGRRFRWGVFIEGEVCPSCHGARRYEDPACKTCGDSEIVPVGADALPTIDIEELDPGIRETVAWLRSIGFWTTDSGDGMTKPEDERTLDGSHIIMVTDDLVAEVERLGDALRARGIVLFNGPRNAEEAEAMGVGCWGPPPEATVRGYIQGNYAPGGPGVIVLGGVDDAVLGAMGGE